MTGPIPDDLLPPADPSIDAPDVEVIPPGAKSAPEAERAQAQSADDVAAINEHIDNLIAAAASAGADMMPAQLRDEYEESFTTSRMIRAGVVATGIGPALHELMPTSHDANGGGAVKKLHPLVRVLLGVAVLGVGIVAQKKAVLNAHTRTNGPSGRGNDGSGGAAHSIPLSQGGPHD